MTNTVLFRLEYGVEFDPNITDVLLNFGGIRKENLSLEEIVGSDM